MGQEIRTIIKNGKEIVIFKDMEILKTDWDSRIETVLDPIVYNQKPFLYVGITVGEYFVELEYFGQHHKEFLKGTYVPLWEQEEKIAEEIRRGILERHSLLRKGN